MKRRSKKRTKKQWNFKSMGVHHLSSNEILERARLTSKVRELIELEVKYGYDPYTLI